MGLLWGYLWDFFVVPMLFHVISMIFLWDFCRIPMGFPWYVYDISLGLLLDLWDVDNISMGFLWGFKRMSM